jgi:two-component system OmpR family sensor kinase
MDQADLDQEERARLEHGQHAVRIADWGYYETVLAPLDKQWLVRLHSPPDPLDINVLSWGVTVLIGAAMLGCLLLWVWPHWRDLERLKETARRLGQGDLAERTQIPPHSNIGELAGVFDTMAGDLERHVNQQRELLNAVSHELRTPLTRLDFGLVLLFDEVPPPAASACWSWSAMCASWMNWCWSCCPTAACRTPIRRGSGSRCRCWSWSTACSAVSPKSSMAVVSSGRCAARASLPRFVLDPRLTARAVQNLVRNAMRYCDEPAAAPAPGRRRCLPADGGG